MYIEINEVLRLKPLTIEDYRQAVKWYEDKNILWYSENRTEPYDLEIIDRMYTYLSSVGDVYVIEYYNGGWCKIGDVTLSKICMPMVILPEYQSMGIGSLVLSKLIERAKELKFDSIELSGIYTYNAKSLALYKKHGFKETHRDESKVYLKLDLISV